MSIKTMTHRGRIFRFRINRTIKDYSFFELINRFTPNKEPRAMRISMPEMGTSGGGGSPGGPPPEGCARQLNAITAVNSRESKLFLTII